MENEDEGEGESESAAEHEESTERNAVREGKEHEDVDTGDGAMHAEETRILWDGQHPSEGREEQLAETLICDDGGAEGKKEIVYTEEVNDDPQDGVDEDVASESPI